MPVQTEVPQDAALRKNIASFESASDWLVEHHNAKWVIFHDATFVDAFDTFDRAAREAIRQFGAGPYLIRRVGRPPVMRMPASVAFRPLDAAR